MPVSLNTKLPLRSTFNRSTPVLVVAEAVNILTAVAAFISSIPPPITTEFAVALDAVPVIKAKPSVSVPESY